jgi:DNA-binding IclR family transcriptional regulator
VAKNSDSAKSPFQRDFSILEYIVESNRPVASADLISDLGLPKATVHRCAQRLEQNGFLQREPVRNRYLAGPRLHNFALAVLSNRVLGAPRHGILKALSQEIGETCNCSMIDGNDIVYFDRVQANWPYRIDLPVGTHLPLHCTASGKLFLAHLPKATRQRLIYHAPMERQTDRTITDPVLLEEELERISSEDVGVDNEELMPGMVAISVPVYDDTNRMCLTIAVHAPTIRKSLKELRQYLPSLRRAAAALSATYFPDSGD